LIFGSGTLDGVTVNGDLDLINGNATVLNGLVLNGTAYLGNQTNANTWGYLSFSGSQAISGSGQVVFGRHGCNAVWLANGGTTLTNRLTLRGHSGQIGYAASCIGGPQNVGVVNEGVISADVAGGTITIRAQPFANQGAVQALNGGSLSLDNILDAAGLSISGGGSLALNGTWGNTGALTVNGSTLSLSGTWTNAGAINFTNSSLNLGGSFGLPTLGLLNRSGGTVNLTGTLDAMGGTLALDATTGSWVMSGGTLRNAVLTASGGAQLIFGSGTLDGVTVNGDLDVGNLNNGASVTVLNGLVLNGTLRLGNPTNQWNGRVDFAGTQTLGGNGTVVLGNQGACNALRLASTDTTLTLGPGVTVRGHSGTLGYSSCHGGPQNVSVINQGTIQADVSGGTLTVSVNSFSNSGTLNALNGATLNSTVPTANFSSTGIIRAFGGSTVNFRGSATFNGNSFLASQPSGTVRLGGSLLGNTQSPLLFTPLGTTTLDGSGNAVAPQFLEVMSPDAGTNAAAFNGPFAYGTLALGNSTYVRLVDLADNSPGALPEALYVNSLIVPAGCTLDLNGLRLYTRAAQLNGIILGNTLNQISDGGTIAQGNPHGGHGFRARGTGRVDLLRPRGKDADNPGGHGQRQRDGAATHLCRGAVGGPARWHCRAGKQHRRQPDGRVD
jgi:hypothetical protein